MTVKYSEMIISYLGQHFDLPQEQVESMLPSFFTALSDHMTNLENAFQQSDLHQLSKTGHTIKGAFLNLGLTDCAEIAFRIEQSAIEENHSVNYAELVTQLRLNVDRITGG